MTGRSALPLLHSLSIILLALLLLFLLYLLHGEIVTLFRKTAGNKEEKEPPVDAGGAVQT